MGKSARITSIDVLQVVSGALQKFRNEGASALDEVEFVANRALGWIHQDCRDYWAREVRRSAEAVNQARVQLQQARTARKIAGHEPALIDEKRALAKAQRRHEHARQKVEAVRRWTHTIEQAVDVYRRNRLQFLLWLDGELVKGVAALDRMTTSLEHYVTLAAPRGDEKAVFGTESLPDEGVATTAGGPRELGDGPVATAEPHAEREEHAPPAAEPEEAQP
jgi:hypothetical protein